MKKRMPKKCLIEICDDCKKEEKVCCCYICSKALCEECIVSEMFVAEDEICYSPIKAEWWVDHQYKCESCHSRFDKEIKKLIDKILQANDALDELLTNNKYGNE